MQIIYTELKNTLEYTCDVNVFNVSMIMRVSYNSRSKKRLISLTSLDGSILYLKPTYITYGSRIFPNFNAIIEGLSFYITLDRLTLTGDNYLNWANQFRLCFVEYIPFEKGDGWYLAENSLEENTLAPNFGEWLIKPDGISVSGDNILFQASKTNSILTYDSFATFNLETALIRSFYDTDMRQWQAFKDAVNELTGVTDWVFDSINNTVTYNPKIPSDAQPYQQKVWTYDGKKFFSNANDAVYYGKSLQDPSSQYNIPESPESTTNSYYQVFRKENGQGIGILVSYVSNPSYDPDAEQEERTLPFDVVAQKVISNAETGEDEILQMLSQDYINLVANSIFDTNVSKQFVKLSDLIGQFEENKTLRS